MNRASKWIALASSNASAAVACRERFEHSSVSRAYFAAYAASHAILEHLGIESPARGNWSHAVLPEALRAALSRGTSGRGRVRGLHAKRVIVELMNQRILADYGANSPADAAAALSRARMIVSLAQEYLK